MRSTRLVLAAALVLPTLALGETPPPGGGDARAGRGFIPTPVFSAEDDQKVLALFDGLRVADVTDGMDAVGLPNVGLMDPEVRPLWKDTQQFTHRFIGVAVTDDVAKAKRIASSVAVLQACSAVTMSMRGGRASVPIDSATVPLRKLMRSKPSRAASSRDFTTSSSRVSMP